MLETIKSYLVSLGFAVDNNSYNQATKAIDKAGESVAKFAGSAVTRFAVASAAVTSFVATAVVGLSKFISGLGEAQIKNEMLARQMWISEDNAMTFSSTLKALKANLNDLYLSPTLAAQFQALRKEADSLRPPDEYKNQMKLVQSVTFEFKRMRLEATYALQWIGYYFVKYMQGPIINIKVALAEINNIIIKTMPHWTKVVAQVMSWFAQMGITTVRAIKDIARVFDDIGKSIPHNLKLIGGAVAALGLIIETGPLGIMIAIFTAAILLLNDFYTYLDGGESAFGPFWKKLVDIYEKFKGFLPTIEEFKKKLTDVFNTAQDIFDGAKKKVIDFYTTLKDNGSLNSLKEAFTNISDIVSSLFETATGWIKQMFSEMEKQGALTDLWNNLKGVVSAVFDLIDAVTGAIKKFLDLDGTKSILKDIGDILSSVVVWALKSVNDLLRELISGLNVISKLFKGDFKGALKSFSDMLTGKNLPSSSPMNPSYIYPSSNVNNNQKSSSVNMNPTFNIFGSDPKTTADAAQNNMDSMYMRSMRGVFV